MSLAAELEQMAAGSAKRFPPEVMAIMRKAADDLEAKDIGDKALGVGDRLPEAALTDATGNTLTIASLVEKGPLIINFYRGGWCPYCNLELKAYQDQLSDIHRLGGELVAVSPEKPDNSLSTAEKNELTFPVLSDHGNAFARSLGIVFELPSELQNLYGQFGMDLPQLNAGSGWTLPIPATFVIGSDGIIKLADVNRDYTRRLEPALALDALREVAKVA
ncbi:MAG: peroxiredoxin-like family protein [Pseudomonadota bacterium]